MDDKNLQQLEKAASQRAGLAGLIKSILDSEEELTFTDIKKRILSAYGLMIDMDMMVGDLIDVEVVKSCAEVALQEKAVDDIRDLLN